MKVAEGFYFVKCPLENIFTGVTIITSTEVALVDTGMPTSPQAQIFPYVRSLGRDPKEITLVINTHAHGDHFGGNVEVRKVTGAKVAAHVAAVWHIEGGVDIAIRDGDVVRVGEVALSVIHTPGHTPCSICLYEKSRRILMTGDAVQGNGTETQGIALYADVDVYRASMEKLLQMDIDILVMDHAYRPTQDAVLYGEEARNTILQSLNYTREYNEAILRILRASKTPLDLETISERIHEIFTPGCVARAHGTVKAHLARLPPEMKEKVKPF